MAAATTYVALLRGVNLGARNKLAMADLRALLEGLGAEDVRTYVQSGNAVLRTGAKAAALAGAIEEQLRREHGLGVPVLLRTKEELAKVVARNPFVAAGKDAAALHVTFLARAPGRGRAVEPPAGEPGELQVSGREVYLWCPDGYGRSKLQNAFLEQRLRVVATTRNWRTVTTLAELAGA